MNTCPPNLPFLELVGYYAKNFAAVGLLMVAGFVIYISYFLIAGMLQGKSKKK